MLPEQHDILFSFLSVLFATFGVFVFGNVIQNCRERELNTTKWGVIFGAFALTMFMMTVHMFGLVQRDQLIFFFSTYIWTILLLLLVWGVFFKSNNIESQSPPIIRGFFFWTTVSVLLAGYTNWLPQQRSDPPPKEAAVVGDLTMEEFAEMGRVIIFG
ncbi:MAG: cytochrome C, partial [Nitrospinota bacterium]